MRDQTRNILKMKRLALHTFFEKPSLDKAIINKALISFQEVVGSADICADYSDYLWLSVKEVAIGSGSHR